MSTGEPATGEAARLARKRRRRARRREDILEAAREVLRREGVAGFTIAGVARAADVSKPSVYYYFADREALTSALAAEVFAREEALAHEVIAAAPGGLRALYDHVLARTRFYAEDLDAYRLVCLWPQIVGVDRELLLETVLPAASRINGALEARLLEERAAGRLHPEVHPRLLVNAAVSASQGVLSIVSGMALMGDNTKFTALAMAGEAAAGLVRGATAPGIPPVTLPPREAPPA